MADLEQDIRARIAQLDSGEVAVSVIDLANGRELHINGAVSMHAASTMKVPVMLELFRRAEQDADFALERRVMVVNQFRSVVDSSRYALDPADDTDSLLYTLVGSEVPIRDLARRMIVRSSNLATNILIELLGAAQVQQTVGRVGGTGMLVRRGVEDGPAFRKGLNNTTTSHGLAKVFEAIARCTVTSRRACDEMLGILADQEFNKMIPAGLPAGIRVAHKTGWITGIDHDGGIVLPPNRSPYVLVVLTRGIADRAAAAAVGADISRIVWNRLAGSDEKHSVDQVRALSELHARYRVSALTTRVFSHSTYWPLVERYVKSPLKREQIGTSAEGRPLYLVQFGSGPQRILLWSQMHGDESTATLALADLMRYLHEARDARTKSWRKQLTILMIPMLNPDGAETFTRHNALGIDVNRDARMLSTPEARALKDTRERFDPQFGFNLHDQNPRSRVGITSTLAAIALLAPPTDSSAQDNDVRLRAKRVAALIRNTIEPLVPGHVAKYDDSFNPRAFGDLMQRWGTSTVLIESGGWKGDPEKQHLRLVNFVALAAAFDAIASGEYEKVDVAGYESLLENGPAANDLLIRGGTIAFAGVAPYRADITIDFGETLGQPSDPRVVEIGDLAHVQARDTVDATGLFVIPSADALKRTDEQRARLVVGALPSFVISRSADGSTEIVYIIEAGRLRKP
jgi:beta-lactamase class A